MRRTRQSGHDCKPGQGDQGAESVQRAAQDLAHTGVAMEGWLCCGSNRLGGEHRLDRKTDNVVVQGPSASRRAGGISIIIDLSVSMASTRAL